MTEPFVSADAAHPSKWRRRRWLMGAVSAAAALGGVGLAWRNAGPQTEGESAEAGLWALAFARPLGGTVRMAALRGQPVLLNFWATWCSPCVEEMPLLSGFYRDNSAKGWQVLGLAVDQPDSVRRFLDKAPVAFPVAMAGPTGLALSRSLGNLSGSLPFSVVLDSDGVLVHRKMGQVTPDDLRAWAALSLR